MALPESLQICRTCVLKSPNMLGIFGEGALGCSIADLINELLDLNVFQGDGLPDKICCNCLNELARFKKFKNISHEAKITLEYILKRDKSEAVPQALKSICQEKKVDNNPEDVQIVDLSDSSDDDSGAETVCAPASPTLSLNSDDDSLECCFNDFADEENDVEIISEPSTSGAAQLAVYSPPKEVSNIVSEDMSAIDRGSRNATTLETADGVSETGPSNEKSQGTLESSPSQMELGSPVDKPCTPTAVFLPKVEESSPNDEETMMVCEDPLSTDLKEFKMEFDQSDHKSNHSDSEVDVEETDEPPDFHLIGQCSRTMPWTKKREMAVTEPSFKSLVPAVNNNSSQKSASDAKEKNDQNECWDQLNKRCSMCSNKFKNFTELRDHVRRKECFVMKCSFCNTLLLKAQFQGHLRFCVEKPLPYTCRICGKSFSQFNALNGHLAVHSVIGRVNPCFSCGAEFNHTRKLREHRKTCCSSLISLSEEPRFPIYRCGECNSAYTKAFSLKRHINDKRHMLCLCGDCGFSCTGFSELSKHFLVTHENWCFICRKCGKKFVDQGRWNNHVAICTDSKAFHCRSCKLKFHSKTKYVDHINRAH